MEIVKDGINIHYFNKIHVQMAHQNSFNHLQKENTGRSLLIQYIDRFKGKDRLCNKYMSSCDTER